MIYLDIETLDFFQDVHIARLPREAQLAAMRFGCAVTYHSRLEQWREWRTPSRLLDKLIWDWNPVVGWNILDFDLPVIANNAVARGWTPGEQLPYAESWRDCLSASRIIDLMALIRDATRRWYSLETVAVTNLGRGKLADGQQAAEWLRSGGPEQIARALEYCRHDVQLVIDLHAILLRGEPLRLPPRAKRQEINEMLWWLDGRVEYIPDALGAIGIK